MKERGGRPGSFTSAELALIVAVAIFPDAGNIGGENGGSERGGVKWRGEVFKYTETPIAAPNKRGRANM